MKFQCAVTDLWNGTCGWSANCSWVRRVEIEVPDDASDALISRRVKRALGIQGMRRDAWSGAEFSWRDGCIGAWAECVVD